MTSARILEAEAIRDDLIANGIRATLDPAQATNMRPCVLIAPPVVDYAAGTYAGPELSWRLIVLANASTGTLAAWRQLDELLAALEAPLVAVVVEKAEPAAYPLSEAGTVPAYIATCTT